MRHENPAPIGRFEITSLLGEGGMGSVYKAWDPDLERWVALKILKTGSPDQVARFQREARAQARIQHDNVCPVYEVGADDGRPYIAMALVPGVDLRTALPEMSTEQLVQVFIDVADALHAAHCTGLIHRDVKPSNIMVESGDSDGCSESWHAWVMDFGIAWEISGEDQTATGVVLGTPSYMAPEQVSGQRGVCDRRTDVYGLGATLYEAVTNRPPFQGATGIEILLQVDAEEPKPPRSLNPSIPTDLETIILKCLDKDPNRRYESARAMADDLRRFLNNDPILARRTEWSYRIAKKLRKHAVTSAVVALAILSIASVTGYSIHSELQAREKAELAQRFGQQVSQIESALRIESLLPLHSIRPKLEELGTRLGVIEEQMQKLGAVAQGPGHYAIGRGHLALDRLPEARSHLEQAWKLGVRGPEAASALGLTLGQIYQHELQQSRQIKDREERARHRRKIELQLRDPALAYLREGNDRSAADNAYVQGLIALYENNFDEAMERAQQAYSANPSLFEALILIAQIEIRRAYEAIESGQYEAAQISHESAEDALETAINVARSDPGARETLCELMVGELSLASLQGTQEQQLYTRGTEICAEAVQADPERIRSLITASHFHWLWAESLMRTGVDPATVLERSIALARRACANPAADEHAFNNLGVALGNLAYHQLRSGEDPTTVFSEAISAFDRSTAIAPNSFYSFNNRGLARWRLGNWKMANGADPLSSWSAASSDFRAAVERNPESTVALANIGAIELTRALYVTRRGEDPEQALDAAIEAFERSLEINPRLAVPLSNLGAAHSIRAEYRITHGLDPRNAIDQAMEVFQRSARENPTNAKVFNNLGSTAAAKATYEIKAGLDPSGSLNQALEYLDRAIELDSRGLTARSNRARVFAMMAEQRIASNMNPKAHFEAAELDLKAILEINPRHAGAFTERSRLARLEALWHHDSGQAASSSIARAVTYADRALTIKADEIDAFLAKAEAYQLAASWFVDQRPQNIDLGLAAVDDALAINPDRANASMLRGALLLLAAEEADTATSRIEKAGTALTAFEEGVAMDPLLERQYADRISRARSLAESRDSSLS